MTNERKMAFCMVYLLYQLQEVIFYDGKQSEQIQMVILDIDSMIPDTHLPRRIKNCVNFDFIYEKAAPYYSPVGRKSIDPVVLIKMLLISYLYGIKSERRLEEEYFLILLTAGFVELI